MNRRHQWSETVPGKYSASVPWVVPPRAGQRAWLGFAILAACAVFMARGGWALAADQPGRGPRWAEDWSAKRLDRVLAYYAPDAVFVQPTGERVTGKGALQELFERTLAANDPQIEMTPLTAGAARASGCEAGSYRETITPTAGGPAQHFAGRHLLLVDTQPDGLRLDTPNLRGLRLIPPYR